MDRATVAKYADMDDMTPNMDRRRGSKIDPYAALVDGWLEAVRMLPRKQRHTAKRVHDRLRAETGYDGEYTFVLRALFSTRSLTPMAPANAASVFNPLMRFVRSKNSGRNNVCAVIGQLLSLGLVWFTVWVPSPPR